MFLWQGVAVFQEVRTGRSVSVPCPRWRCQSRDSVLSARPAERFVGGSRPRPLWRNKSSIHLRFAGAGAVNENRANARTHWRFFSWLNHDWMMYQCWESNSRPRSPVSCGRVVLADDVPWLPLARANSKVEKCVLWSFAVRRHWQERRKGMGPYAMRALASTRWIASEVISCNINPLLTQDSSTFTGPWLNC